MKIKDSAEPSLLLNNNLSNISTMNAKEDPCMFL